MKGYTLAELRSALQSVRGETRIKATEEGIRNEFLQAACDEIFAAHNWTFNKRTAEVDFDEGYPAPKDFSVLNDFWFVGSDGVTYSRDALDVTVLKGKSVVTGPSAASGVLHYYCLAPDLSSGSTLVYFPQKLLIAERAYVRLKTAYFPDESSEKELKENKAALRDLFTGNRPKRNFSHPALG